MQILRSHALGILTAFILNSSLPLSAATFEAQSVGDPVIQVFESDSETMRITARMPEQISMFSESTEDVSYVPGFAVITQPGKPEIPFISRNFLIPPTGGVRLGGVNTESRTLRALRTALLTVEGNSIVNTSLETGPDGFWPASSVIIGEPAILRGYRMVNVTMFLEQVNLATGEVRRNDNFDFDLEFNGPEVNPVENPGRGRSSLNAWRAVRSLVENPPPPPRDDPEAGGYLYIVPDNDDAIEALAPLVEWRKRQGYKVSVQVVGNNALNNEINQVIRTAYRGDPQVEFVTLVGDASRGQFNVPAFSQEGDWGYTLQEGNDALADIAVGRLSCRTTAQLQIIVNKLVSYEADPFDGNEDWYLQGGVISGSSINGISEVFVAKYVRKELRDLGFNDIRSYYWTENGGDLNGARQVALLQDWFRWGMSVFHYRAFHLMNNLPIEMIAAMQNREGRWPAVLTISCETGNFTGNADGYTEAFLRSEGGGIGAIGTATPNTNVKFNNLVAGGVWKGIYKQELYSLGWGLNAGKYELWRAFSGLDNNYISFMEWNNLMGDAGTELWTGVPRRIEVTHQATVSLGQSDFVVTVEGENAGDPIAGARVCLYKGEELHQVVFTDENGAAEFTLDPAALDAGTMLVTVSKHNVRPYLGEVTVGQSQRFLGVEDWYIDDGDGGDYVSPGRSVEFNFDLKNFGRQPLEGRIGYTITSATPWIAVESDTIWFEDSLAAGEVLELHKSLAIARNCPDGAICRLNAVFLFEEEIWSSAIEVEASAPLITVEGYQVEDGAINPGEIRNISFRLGNFGSISSEGFVATLISPQRDLIVHQNQAGYIGLDIGGMEWESGQPFRISTNNNIVPGRQFPLVLQILFDDSTTATAATMLTVGRPGLRDPFGPDEYGYVCFDSYDTAWAMAPDYDWIEIDPSAQRPEFQGTQLNIRDTGDNQDVSRMVELPFNFKYYGQDFDRITICSNGWAAFGDQSELADFRNTHIGQALGPSAQLCAWWDNLVTPNGSGIYTYYDRQGGMFIIEWSRLARLLENDRYGATETFQIILYDQTAMPTPGGDGVITYQYLNITNENRPAHNDIPFCTVGIGNLDDSGGLEYTYWSRYTPGARELRSQMAVTFTPVIQVISGVVRGIVLDLETSRPIPGITVRSNRRGLAVTDDRGVYYLDLAIGEDYMITAGGLGWNDSTQAGISLAQNDTIFVGFALRHPEFAISNRVIERRLNNETRETVELTITNDGNGPLRWEAEKLVEGEGDPVGNLRFSFPAGQRVGNNGLVGVTQAGDRFYASGRRAGGEAVIYVFDERGAQIDSFPQPGAFANPMPDLAWDGELLWGAGGRNIYGFDTEGNLSDQNTFAGPHIENHSLAWDPVRELLWVGGAQPNNPVYGVNRRGGLFSNLLTRGLQIRGLGYWPGDPDDFPLYLLCAFPDTLGGERSMVYKYSLTGRSDTMFVTELESQNREFPRGMDVTSDFSVYDWSMVVLKDDLRLDHGGDHIDVYQLGIVTTWLGVRPLAGEVSAESSGQLFIDLNSTGIDSGTVTGEVTIHHNAVDGEIVIPVTLHVTGLDIPSERDPMLPVEVSLLPAYPSPFNASCRIAYALPTASEVRLAVFDLQGRMVANLTSGYHQPGNHEITLNAIDWPAGVYAVQLNAAGSIRTMKIVCIK